MEEQTITQFGWGVEDVYDDPDEENPDRKLVNRTLHITVLMQVPIVGNDGRPIGTAPAPVRVIHLPFGTLDSGRGSWENLALAMQGKELPPAVDIVRPGQMLGHRGPNGIPRS